MQLQLWVHTMAKKYTRGNPLETFFPRQDEGAHELGLRKGTLVSCMCMDGERGRIFIPFISTTSFHRLVEERTGNIFVVKTTVIRFI